MNILWKVIQGLSYKNFSVSEIHHLLLKYQKSNNMNHANQKAIKEFTKTCMRRDGKNSDK